MKHLYEYKSFNYSPGDIVLIHYWWDGRITPVEVLEKNGYKYDISHNVEGSEIKNAPNETIKGTQIIDIKRKKS